jgi:hypothetical protein
MELSGQLRNAAALHPNKEPTLPIFIVGWVGPRAGLDFMEKKQLLPLRLPACRADERMVIRWILHKHGVDRIKLPQYSAQFLVLVNTAIP